MQALGTLHVKNPEALHGQGQVFNAEAKEAKPETGKGTVLHGFRRKGTSKAQPRREDAQNGGLQI